jgi:hypothetical protein
MNQSSTTDFSDSDGSSGRNEKCNPLEIEFVSRQCKTDEHSECDGQWSGFGFQIVCSCKCGHWKERPALEGIGGLHSNESQPASSYKPTGCIDLVPNPIQEGIQTMDNTVLAYIRIAKVGYTRLLRYTDYINQGYSKDGTIGE